MFEVELEPEVEDWLVSLNEDNYVTAKVQVNMNTAKGAEPMARTTMRELHERRLAAMTTEERDTFDGAYRHATLAARVGEIVRDARTAADLSQRELAARMGTSQPVVARIEAGHVGATLTSIQKIADALNKDVEISFTLKNAS